ncbi:MAG: AAA family ATPase [Pirellulales bacterium]|nr:AAA family ATPase [Pirellulales bacterium]
MSQQVQIECGPADRLGKRAVIASLGSRQHIDKYDVSSAYHRSRYCERVISRFGLPPDAHEWIDGRIIEEAVAVDASETSAVGSAGRWQPKLVRLADVESRPVQWLWPGRIALGRLSLLVGMPGAGKSFLTCDMAARISTGTPWPDGSPCDRGSVLLITAEDDPADTIRPRLDAHHADASRVHLLAGLHRAEGDGDAEEAVFSLERTGALETALSTLNDCRLIVVDPIGSFLGARTDSHRDNEVRAVLAPIGKLAERYGPAVLVVAHRRKSAATVADDTALGSRAFTGIARSVWHLARDGQSRQRRLLLPGKSNLSSEQPGLAFSIGGEPAAIQWEREPVAMSADDALAREQSEPVDPSAVDDAVAWLTEELAAGPRTAKELRDGAKADGIAWRTVERAKAKLRIENGPDGFGGPWVWTMPDGGSLRQESSQSAKVNPLADSGETVADSDAWPIADDEWMNDSF